MHVYPPSIPTIRGKHDDKSGKDFIKLKLRRDLTSEKLDPYEFKITLFKNGDPEEFLSFVRNVNMTLDA